MGLAGLGTWEPKTTVYIHNFSYQNKRNSKWRWKHCNKLEIPDYSKFYVALLDGMSERVPGKKARLEIGQRKLALALSKARSITKTLVNIY